MIDEKLLFILFIILVSFLNSKKKRRRPMDEGPQQEENDENFRREWEEMIRRERERRAEAQRRQEEFEAQQKRREEVWVEEEHKPARPKKQLPFEIPTIRKADPKAETRLPQHDKIFIKEKKEPAPFIEPTLHKPRKEKTIEPAYLKKLNSPVVMPPEVHIPSVQAPQRRAWRPAKSALVQGIIMAEVLGAPKAYQNRTRSRRKETRRNSI